MNKKTIFKKISTALGIIVIMGMFFVVAKKVQAYWIYYPYSVPYTVTVIEPITVSVTATSTSLAYGGTTTVSWTAVSPTPATTYCVPDNGPFAGVRYSGLTGSFLTTSLYTTTTYSVTCYDK